MARAEKRRERCIVANFLANEPEWDVLRKLEDTEDTLAGFIAPFRRGIYPGPGFLDCPVAEPCRSIIAILGHIM
jgi:hypothetical protein